jgi:hypothetical protein
MVDENTICFLGTEGLVSGRNENFDFYKIEVITSETIRLTDEFNKTLESGNLISDSIYKDLRSFLLYKGRLYFRMIENHKTILCKIDLDGVISNVFEREGTIDSFDFHNDNLIYVGMNSYEFHDIFIVLNEMEKKLTYYNEWLDEKTE